jgi:hypothetical protein
MMRRVVFILVVMLVLSTSVAAVSSAKCEGNTLVYYDRNNNVIKRDCSILHSGSGEVFRGVCKTYVGGADCWRTDGSVTPEYRDVIRNITHTTYPWDPAYEPTTIVTTTTLPFAAVECPVCPTCKVCEDITPFINLINTLNASAENNKRNADAYRAMAEDKVDRKAMDDAIAAKDSMIRASYDSEMACQKQLGYEKGWNSTYLSIAAISVVLALIIIFVWVKYEFIGGKMDDAFAEVAPKKKR